MEPVSILDLHQFQSQKALNGFHINTLNLHIAQNTSLITKPHKHNSYLYVLFTKGNGKHEIDFAVYDVRPGSCFMIAPGQTHHWTLSEDCDGFIITHTRDFYDLYFSHNRIRQFPFFESGRNNPLVIVEGTVLDSLTRLMHQILNEYQEDVAFKSQKIMALTDLVYIETSRIYLSGNSPDTVISTSYLQKFRQFENLVETYFLTEKSASFYAGKMSITAKHLNRIVRETSSKTTSEVILERTLLEAKRKIIHLKQSFAEISNDLGFEDYAYFSRLFKSKTGKTPTDFQKSYQSL